MKLFFIFFAGISTICFSQNSELNTLPPKGEHYVLYNKCKSAVTFCELTQQDYLLCGAVKNCYGLYVLPGDTFYINIEDKMQSEIISADISFDGYFPAINGCTFEPVDINCMATQALQIAIPLTAVSGSSFQIVAQNTDYVNSSLIPGVPMPFPIFVGGQQPQYTFALSDFTLCPVIEGNDVAINEIELKDHLLVLYPNPSEGIVSVMNFNEKNCNVEIYDMLGNKILKLPGSQAINLTTLCKGIYFFKVIYNNEIFISEKLVLTK